MKIYTSVWNLFRPGFESSTGIEKKNRILKMETNAVQQQQQQLQQSDIGAFFQTCKVYFRTII